MAHVKYRDHPTAGNTPEQRVAARLRNSGDCDNADTVVQKGSGPTRAFTNIHNAGTAKQSGPADKGVGRR